MRATPTRRRGKAAPSPTLRGVRHSPGQTKQPFGIHMNEAYKGRPLAPNDPNVVLGTQPSFNVVETDEDYTLGQNDNIIIVSGVSGVTLTLNPVWSLTGTPNTVVADGVDVTVAGNFSGGATSVLVPAGTLALFSYSPITETYSFLISSADHSAAQAQTIWYIDPANTWTGGTWTPTSVQTTGVGKASDSNDGLTSETPLLTFAQVVLRWGTTNPTFDQATTIIFLSDQPGFTDPVDITPILNQVNLTIIGTPTVIASDTFATYASRLTTGGYATGTLDYFTGRAITDFTPFTDLMVRTATATFWISADETTATFPAPTAYVSPPMQTIVAGSGAFLSPGDPSGPVPPPPWVVPVGGERFDILQPCSVFVTRLQFDLSATLAHVPSDGVGQQINGIILQNVWVQNPPPLPGVNFDRGELVGENMFLQQCRLDVSCPLELGIWRMSKINCDFTDLVSPNSRYYGGIIAFASPLQNFFGQTFDGDCIIRFGVGELAPVQAIFGTVYAGIFSSAAGNSQAFGAPPGNGNPGDVLYLMPNGGSVFYCPPASGPGPTSPQVWGQNVSLSAFNGTTIFIVNAPGVTATTCFPSISAPAVPVVLQIDGVGGGTQLASYKSGVWTPFAGPLTPAALDALNPAGNTPETASVQNPDTGSKIAFNAGQFPFS